MNATASAWVGLVGVAVITTGLVLLWRRRTHARRAYGPVDVGDALRHGRERLTEASRFDRTPDSTSETDACADSDHSALHQGRPGEPDS